MTSTVITIDNGVVTLNVFPLVNGALATLQAEGVIPASVTLPELSASSTPSVARTALQSALGITLPADFGTIALVQADRLEAAQTAVRVFDLLVIVAIVVTILLFVAAAYIARDRRRAVILLGVGAVIALLVARAGLRGLENAIVDSVANADGAVIARGLFDTVLNDLFGLMVIVTAIGAAVAIVAWLIGRREQIRELAGSTGSVVRQKTAAGTGAAKAMAASASDRAGGAAAGGAAAAVPATVGGPDLGPCEPAAAPAVRDRRRGRLAGDHRRRLGAGRRDRGAARPLRGRARAAPGRIGRRHRDSRRGRRLTGLRPAGVVSRSGRPPGRARRSGSTGPGPGSRRSRRRRRRGSTASTA